MTHQDIQENNLTVVQAHTNDFHQQIDVIESPEDWYGTAVDIADMYNDLDFTIEADLFAQDIDPAGGHGLSSHI